MTELAQALLRNRLDGDPDAAIATLAADTDSTLSIGRDVWRLSWRGQATTAVTADAGLATTCGALLDSIALHESGWGPVTDRDHVNVLVHRPPPTPAPTETDQAVRTLRDAGAGFVSIWYDEHGRWVEDLAQAPVWPADDARVTDWVHRLLIPRLTAAPTGLPVTLVAAVADPSVHLYPSDVTRGSTDVWAVRIDGLEIGTLGAARGVLRLGAPRPGEPIGARAAFRAAFGADEVSVSLDVEPGSLGVADAAARVLKLLYAFRGTTVTGAPVTHRGGDNRIVNEHALEARLLKGLLRLDDGTDLVGDDADVARGSQFPTLWGHGGPARYLDALLRRGTTPVAVELKVATGGQGRYYRRAITQAVLYRHFIANAAGLDPWFNRAGLERHAVEAVVGIPIPHRYTHLFRSQVDLLTRVAARVDVSVNVLDDRAAGEWEPEPGLPEPPIEQFERLTWQLAAALSARWPRSFGRLCDSTDAGGFYDLLCLQHTSDRSLDWPAERPRLRINREASVWIFNQLGQPRWVWHGAREQLANGTSAGDAAQIIGRMAGAWPPERPDPDSTPEQTTFAELAAEFLEVVPVGGWQWRNAWRDGQVHDWVARFGAPLRRYTREAPVGQLPTISRIWGAIHDGEASVVVDQENLRIWAWTDGNCIEITNPELFTRIREAAALALN